MKYIVDAGASNLTKSQEDLLDNLDKLVFPFEGFSTLSEIKSRRQIDVHISTRGYIVKKADDYIKLLDAEITRMLKDIERNRLKLSDCEDIKSRVLKIKNRAKCEENPLLGCYYPYESSPEVYLFIDNIQDYVERYSKTDYSVISKRTVDNVCGFVYVHEMMHAYFDSINNEGFYPVEEIEEAFAEYGMLFFLEQYSDIFNDLYAEAYDDVKHKLSYGPGEYGFGFALYKEPRIQVIDWISRYAQISNWLSKSHSSALKRYSENVVKLCWQLPSLDTTLQQCLVDVEDVLNYNWQQPQHSVKNLLNVSNIANNIQQPSNQLQVIIQNCLNDFSKVATNPCVVPSSIPVLWFGDMDKYMHSKVRVVTVGNNPSAREFSPNRFPGASLTNINDYYNALNNYFNYDPLNWFKWNEQALNGLGVSFGGKMIDKRIAGSVDNIALHIDFHTPVATVDRWSQIPASQRNSLSSLFNKYYHQMLDYLAPDVIIIGINEPSFRAAFPCFGTKPRGKDIAPAGSTGYIRLFKLLKGKKCTVVWNKFRDTPFNGVGGYNAIKRIIAINKPLILV